MARSRVRPTIEPALIRFAARLRKDVGAERVLLFGSRASGRADADSDYDLIVVAERFASIERPRRAIGLRQLWYEEGGDSPMDLICLTPEEFATAERRISLVAAVLPEAIELLSAA